MNKRIRKKKQKQLEKCLLDLATAIDAGIQEYWRWRETMMRIRKTRHTLAAAVTGDVFGIVLSALAVRMLLLKA